MLKLFEKVATETFGDKIVAASSNPAIYKISEISELAVISLII